MLPSFAEVSLSLAVAPPAAGMGDTKFATVILTVYGGSMIEVAGLATNVGNILPKGALVHTPITPIDFAKLYALVDQSFPGGARYGVDCLWSEDADATFAGLANMIATAPSTKSNAIGVIYGRNSALHRRLPEAALSRIGSVCGIMHGTWESPDEDASNLKWLRAGMDALNPVTTGRYVGHADLARPGRMEACHSATARQRLIDLAATYDPQRVFAGRLLQERANTEENLAVIAAE